MRFDDTIVIESRDEQRKSLGGWTPKASFERVEFRAIDNRPCEPVSAADSDWGEQDSLANVPRAKSPAWVRTITLEPGDA